MAKRDEWFNDWFPREWFPEDWFPEADTTVVTIPEPDIPQLLELFQEEVTTFALRLYDAAGQARDISGLDLRFIVQTHHRPPLGIYKLELGGGLQVGGDSQATILVTLQETETAKIGQWSWLLWNLTDNEVLLHGLYRVRPARKDAA